MSFSPWHWAIVFAISAFAFRRQLSSLILYLTDPSRALRERLGMLDPKDREAMIQKQASIRLKLKQKAWFVVVAAFALIFAWKALRYWTGSS
jgi:hypothetical protein